MVDGPKCRLNEIDDKDKKQALKVQLSTAQLEPPEEQRRRFEIECEFVQALANPHYVNFLAQRGFLKEQHFINYLKYLLYWKQPEYARYFFVFFLLLPDLQNSVCLC
ncbi:unnamed protein product [Nippostrongylus brasiliensis]|uniref:Mediator of RNA polymerase II transcription subunit 31 n=1 Tax=Nippostrongylus brasiliensis TaxID=27835 RepID=A0A0N4YLP3_NIPBR|nr:unnamed protein product [Nippostrongylus brasiliensis]